MKAEEGSGKKMTLTWRMSIYKNTGGETCARNGMEIWKTNFTRVRIKLEGERSKLS